MLRITSTILFFLFILSSSYADNLYSLIKHGKLGEASDSLSQKTSASNRDGDLLFYQSMLEENADKSAQMMEAALRASVSAHYRQEISLKLAQYYYLTNDLRNLERIVSDYLIKWENGVFRKDMIRYSVLIDEYNQKHETAIRQLDRFIMEFSDDETLQWGTIDKARVMAGFKKNVAARNLLRSLAKEKSGPGVSQALYLLAADALDLKKTDDAVFYYNLCREGYPAAVGLEATIARMSGMSVSGDRDGRAEERTGTFYSIQVGVYSNKENAERRAKEFEKFNEKVDINTKKISEKNYRVVYVGHFTSYNSALTFKKMLESKFGEVFQVKTR